MARQKTATAAIRFEANLDTLKSQLKDARKIVSEFQEGTRLTLSADDKNMFKGLLESLSGVETKIDAINTAAKNSTIDEVFKKMGMSAEELKGTLDGITAKLDGLSKLKTSVKDTFDPSAIAVFKTELQGLAQQVSNISIMFGNFGSTQYSSVEDLAKKYSNAASRLRQMYAPIQEAINATNLETKSEYELGIALDANTKKAAEYTAALQALDTKKEASKNATHALEGKNVADKIDALKQKWAEMLAIQNNVDKKGSINGKGEFVLFNKQQLDAEIYALKEAKKFVIELQKSLASNVNLSTLGMKDITGEDQQLRSEFKKHEEELARNEQRHLANVRAINDELNKRKAVGQLTGDTSASTAFLEKYAALEAEVMRLSQELALAQSQVGHAITEASQTQIQAQNATQQEIQETSISLDNLLTKLQQYTILREQAHLESHAFNENMPSGTRGAVYAESKKSAKSSMLQLLQEIDTKQDEINHADQQDILLIRQKNKELITLKATLLGIYDSFSHSLGGSDKFLGSDLVNKISTINQEMNNISGAKTNTGYKALFDEVQAITKIDPYALATVFENANNKGLSSVQILREFNSLVKQQPSTTSQPIEQMSQGTVVDSEQVTALETKVTDLTAKLETAQQSMTTLTQSAKGAAAKTELETLRTTVTDLSSQLQAAQQEMTELNKAQTGDASAKMETLEKNTTDAASKIETLEKQITELSNKLSTSAGSEEIKKIGEAATAANTKIESLEQNVSELVSKLDNMASAMGAVATASQNVTNANVTGTVNVGNKVPVTGGGGEQLALEKTLRATYSIQQNMVKILSEINAKMVSGANAATASYEQLRAVMTETVNAAKNLGAEEEKQVKKSGNAKSNEHYAIMKKNLQEVLRLKKQLPKAGEQETQQIKSQIKRLNERARYHQKAIKDANAIIPIRQQEVDILREQAKIQDAINTDTRKKVAATAKQDAAKKLESSYNSTSKTLRSIGSGEMMNTAESATVQGLITKFKEYDALLATVGNDFEKLSNDQQKEIQESIDKFNQLTQTQKEAFKAGAYNVYNKGGKYKGELTDLNQDSSLSGIKGQVDSGAISRQAALEQIAAATVKARIETVQYDEATGQLTARFRDQQKNLQEIKIAFQDVGNATRHTTQTVEEYQNAFGKMFGGVGKKLKELLRYFSAFTIVMRVINAIKHGVTVVREMNTALTEMKLVTESTTAEMAKAEKQIQQVAATVASTNVDIAKSATDWAKLGYSMSDALELAGVSAKYAKVGFTDVATASENLTATLQAFYSKDLSQGLVDAGDLAGTITDKFVLVGNKFASSAEGLGRGMTEAGSALVAANNSLDESLALITAGTTVLQDESETANAVRTISLRLRGTKASQLEEMGETDLTGVIEDTSKLYKIVKDMTSVNGKEGVEIFNPDTQAYKSTYEIMLEISKVWDEMTDVQRAKCVARIYRNIYLRTYLIAGNA